MSEILPTTLDKGTTRNEVAAEPQSPTWGEPGEKVNKDFEKREGAAEEEEMVSSAKFEPATLQWSDVRGLGKTTENRGFLTEKGVPGIGKDGSGKERQSLRWTESERELRSGDRRRTGIEIELQDPELRKSEVKGQVEIKVLEDNINTEKPATVFDPPITVLRSLSAPVYSGECEELWGACTETSPCLGPQRAPPDGYYHDLPVDRRSSKCGCDCVNRDALKVGVSVFTAALIFPMLVWGGYVFLPFDAPLLDSAPLRLVYTLRCSVFAVVPIVLGWLVLGVTRMRSREVKPLAQSESGQVGVHRRYVDDSVTLFLLYFLQLAVMAPYLSQAMVKLVPLLTIIFAVGRLIYWMAAAMGSSVRGFGFGLSFLPTVVMLVANLYFIFTVDAEGSIFAQEMEQQDSTPNTPKQRFWG
ncbi:hypothetical protein DPEC_G00352400 [Dallia pectoralis]|uniref:Uncharacterized protein n=1 Tax=Dallia pectoralis TaxID=75939 RepID=A0ACC2F275_DALPE|nr:hypothetical protein DPEC_G00352400 [Dallia pectoralis]